MDKTINDYTNMMMGEHKTQQQFDTGITNAKIAKITAKIDACVFDLNKLTRDGWEIKASSRVWQDFNDNGNPDSYEWGTEYTLQKKKGWW